MHKLSAAGECFGKAIMSRAKATAAARRLRTAQAYRCGRCDRWHVGTHFKRLQPIKTVRGRL